VTKKRMMVLTGGGDCPGLNAVIRGVVKRARLTPDWEVFGSIEAFNGVLTDPMDITLLDGKAVSGIHVRGGTILKTTNKGGPFEYPVKQPDGSWHSIDRSDELLQRLQRINVQAVINIGGEGSQDISQRLYEKGLNIIGVPKTIDNDLSSTDFTFGFQSAVQVATEAVDKLVTTAASHNRLMILEVMGRDAGWIALSAAIAGGADVCLIPEIPYDINKVAAKLNQRIQHGKGFAIIVIAEGAKALGGEVTGRVSQEVGYKNLLLGGVGHQLQADLKPLVEVDSRVMILGHLQRGGSPVAFDRILATQFGVKAVEMVLESQFGQMVAYRHPHIISVPLKEAISEYNRVKLDSHLVRAARGVDITLGD
jgi:ATP-dependent phosphofructokinase / diphosphate-dependent phosphofructokinase